MCYCYVCDEPFPYKSVLEKHILSIHKMSDSHPCLFCYKTGFVSKSALACHVFTNHVIVNEMRLEYQCPICFKIFERQGNMDCGEFKERAQKGRFCS